MQVLAGLGLMSFLLVSTVLGIRLVRLSRRTQELPELAMGLAFLLCGAVGYSQILASHGVVRHAPHLQPLLYASGSLMLALGSCCLNVFTWRVFRPSGAGTVVFGLVTATLLGAFVGQAFSGAFDAPGMHGVFPWVTLLALAASFLWPSLESFRYAGMLRRRERVGLADPRLVRTFVWWGIGTGAASLIYVSYGVVAVLGMEDLTHPASMLPTAALGVLAAFAVAKAFAPKRGGEGRAGEVAGS